MKLTTLKPRVATQALTALPHVNSDSWRTSNQSAADRGYDTEWRRARDAYLTQNPICVMCDAEGYVTAANVVDHKIAHRGDKELFWDKTNWQSLCMTHHNSHAQIRDNAQKNAALSELPKPSTKYPRLPRPLGIV